MRLHFALIVPLFSSALFALPLDKQSGNTNSVISGEVLEKSFNHEVYQKRDEKTSDPIEVVRNRFKNVVGDLRGFVTENSIDYAKFENDKNKVLSYLSSTEALMKKSLKVGHFLVELSVTKRFYEALETSLNIRERFEGCEYPGADLVKNIMDVGIQAMALYYLENLDEKEDHGYMPRFLALQLKFKSLESADISKLTPAMTEILTKQISQSRGSIGLLEELNLYAPPLEEEK